jgi:monofunctional biosynthetic peptidoglycan transglycosylase
MKFTRWVRNLLIFFFTSTILATVILKYIPVYITPLMLIRCIEAVIDGDTPQINHHWVPLERINHNLPQAVMASEDNLFLKHGGFDLEQIQKAQIEAQEGKRQRGASTISQQTARNVFLWQQRSWVRKGLEAYFTFLIEAIWGKERIMEVYLNSIEMGNGIYGADAVARINFDTTPDKLTRSQSAYVAVSLPNPRRMNSARPSSYMLRRQQRILHEMKFVKPFPPQSAEPVSSPPRVGR